MSIIEYTKPLPSSLSAPIWVRNPVLSQLLGLSPLLAISTTATKGVVFGLISAILCIAAVTINSFFHTRIKSTWRFVWYLFLTASLTTAIDLILHLTRLPLHGELGYYLPLLACNFTILVHLEIRYQDRSAVTPCLSFKSSLSYSVGIMLALSLFSCMRELLIFGTVFRDWSLLKAAANSNIENVVYSSSEQLIPFASLPPGAFILLGLILASKKVIDKHFNLEDKETQREINKVERARVTGKL
jgi:electron transport complex protein RnfE